MRRFGRCGTRTAALSSHSSVRHVSHRRLQHRSADTSHITRPIAHALTASSLCCLLGLPSAVCVGCTRADPSIAQALVSFFNCIPVLGDELLAAYPDVSCLHDPQYLSLLPFFVVMLMVVIALPALLFARLWWLNRSKQLFDDAETRFIYGAMTEAYPRNIYAWECMVCRARAHALSYVGLRSTDRRSVVAVLCSALHGVLCLRRFWCGA
jgi:hypothetical protein